LAGSVAGNCTVARCCARAIETSAATDAPITAVAIHILRIDTLRADYRHRPGRQSVAGRYWIARRERVTETDSPLCKRHGCVRRHPANRILDDVVAQTYDLSRSISACREDFRHDPSRLGMRTLAIPADEPPRKRVSLFIVVAVGDEETLEPRHVNR